MLAVEKPGGHRVPGHARDAYCEADGVAANYPRAAACSSLFTFLYRMVHWPETIGPFTLSPCPLPGPSQLTASTHTVEAQITLSVTLSCPVRFNSGRLTSVVKPSLKSRPLISILVIVIVLSGLVCSPVGRHGGMDFDCPVVLLSFSPVLTVTRWVHSPRRVTDRFSTPYLPASPDRAPPSIQTVHSV